MSIQIYYLMVLPTDREFCPLHTFKRFLTLKRVLTQCTYFRIVQKYKKGFLSKEIKWRMGWLATVVNYSFAFSPSFQVFFTLTWQKWFKHVSQWKYKGGRSEVCMRWRIRASFLNIILLRPNDLPFYFGAE